MVVLLCAVTAVLGLGIGFYAGVTVNLGHHEGLAASAQADEDPVDKAAAENAQFFRDLKEDGSGTLTSEKDGVLWLNTT